LEKRSKKELAKPGNLDVPGGLLNNTTIGKALKIAQSSHSVAKRKLVFT
jgi:hypothetical protein